MDARTRRAGSSTWWMSAVATVGSTYALDSVATAGGLATAASGLLDGLAPGWLLAALFASYLTWFLGMRTALAANHDLLLHTGTSTNVLSKIAFELTRSCSPCWRRRACSTGYVATELGKESVYYLGAFGTVAATPATTRDAVVFLFGTNLAAAGYEYLLGRGTMLLLGRRALAKPDPVDEPAEVPAVAPDGSAE